MMRSRGGNKPKCRSDRGGREAAGSLLQWRRLFLERAARGALLALACGCLLLTLGGCSARSPVRALGDGLLQVDCPGGYHDWSGCLAAARRHCGDQGFRIEAEISDEGGSVGTRDWSLEGSEVSRTMEFRCGK